MKASFEIHSDQVGIFNCLSKEQIGHLMMLLFSYHFTGAVNDCEDKLVSLAFTSIRVDESIRTPTRKRGSNPKGDFYNSVAWRKLRYEVLKECDGKCSCCGASKVTGAVIHVDHIKPRSLFPELALKRSNLQVLCDDCNIGKGVDDYTRWPDEVV